MKALKIQALQPEHWPAVEQIYLAGIQTGIATFETASPGWEKWDSSHLDDCRFVALEGQQVAGWVALSPTSDRCMYGGVAEVSVYVAAAYRGRGVGKMLLKAVIPASEEAGIWTLITSMFPQNSGSIGLHRSVGFREIGFREKIGKLNGEWFDNVLMEKRSSKIW